jgi:hypothetical protein
LEAAAFNTGDPAVSGGSPPWARSYSISVTDPQARFLSVRFDATLPYRGLYDIACPFVGSPPWQALSSRAAVGAGSPPAVGAWVPVVPLFSAPSRPCPAGMAVLRASLRLRPIPSGGPVTPASWALLEVTPPGAPPALGLADGGGEMCVIFAWPEPIRLQLSPPSPTTSLSHQSWTVGVRAYFGSASSGSSAIAGPDEVPDLCDVLEQLPATLLADDMTPLVSAPLRYGEETVVTTSGRSAAFLVSAGLSVSPP